MRPCRRVRCSGEESGVHEFPAIASASIFVLPGGAPGRGGMRAPKATIDPDPAKSWLRRAYPLVKAHRVMLVSSLGLSFAGLLVQVQIPNVVRRGIDIGIGERAGLASYLWWILVLAFGQALAAYGARRLLLRTAYELEYDLRTVIYAHLTRMPFAFYDRVQSGELMSRCSSDIRAVQVWEIGRSALEEHRVPVECFDTVGDEMPLPYARGFCSRCHGTPRSRRDVADAFGSP